MIKKIQEGFIWTAAILLFVAAACLLISAVTTPGNVLDLADPFLYLPFRKLFYLVGGVQLALSAFLLMNRNHSAKLGLVAWLAFVSLAYQAGAQFSGELNLFVSLGNLNSWLPVSPVAFSRLAYALHGGLLFGSSSLLVLNWIARRKIVRPAPAERANSGPSQPAVCVS